MNELLAVIGSGGRPLLMFPGLLSAVVATVICHFLWNAPRFTDGWTLDPAATVRAACAVLVLAFLPVPGASWRYGIDVMVALLLLELPHLFALRRHMGAPALRAGAAAEMAALLNVYPLLALAIAAVAQSNGSLVLGDLRGGTTPLWWSGIVAWSVALPPLLAFGPWRVAGNDTLVASLRRVAHVALLAAVAQPASAGYGGLGVACVVAVATLALLDRVWRGRPERWERAQPVIAVLLLATLLYAGATAWVERVT